MAANCNKWQDKMSLTTWERFESKNFNVTPQGLFETHAGNIHAAPRPSQQITRYINTFSSLIYSPYILLISLLCKIYLSIL